MWAIILLTTPISAAREDAPAPTSGIEGTRYVVTVQFTTEATQDDMFDVGAFLRTFDDDLEYLIMEIFPPIGRAVLTTDAADFCQTVEAALEDESYVVDVSYVPWDESNQGKTEGTSPARCE